MMTKEPSIRSRRDRNACTLYAASVRRHLNRTTDTAGQDCINGWQMLLSSDCRHNMRCLNLARQEDQKAT